MKCRKKNKNIDNKSLAKITSRFFIYFTIMFTPIVYCSDDSVELVSKLDMVTVEVSSEIQNDFKKSIQKFSENIDYPSRLKNVLVDLNSKYEAIDLRESNGLFLAGEGAANRVDGLTYYKRVVLNRIKMEQTKDLGHRDVFYLHEGLKAIGYNDKNYSLTLSILLSSLYKSELSEADIINIADNVNTSMGSFKFLSRSGTSVGGGGDHTSLVLKLKYLIDRLYSGARIQEIIKILNVSIEPNTDSRLAYNVTTVIRNNEVVILIPNAVYNLLPGHRMRIERELSKTIKSVLEKN